MAMTDAEQIMHEFLMAAGTALYSAVGTRVWCPVAKKGFENTEQALVFHSEAAGTHITGCEDKNTFVFKCYGGSALYGDARALARTLRDRLHNQRGVDVASGRIQLARWVTGFQGPNDGPDQDWPVYTCKFTVVTTTS